MKSELIIMTILLSLMLACTSIPKEDAKNAAYSFIRQNVAFRSENKTVIDPYMQIVNEEEREDGFVFDIIATTTGEEKVRSAKFNIVVDKKGRVVMFNGKPVSQTGIQSLTQ